MPLIQVKLIEEVFTTCKSKPELAKKHYRNRPYQVLARCVATGG